MKHRKMQRHHLAALIPLFVALSGPASAQSITRRRSDKSEMIRRRHRHRNVSAHMMAHRSK